MKRVAALFASCVLSMLACGPGAGGAGVDERTGEEFIGGWDAEGSAGTAILLIREGLTGTLNIASLQGAERQFHVLFDVEGELEQESLMLALNCAEARERVFGSDTNESDGTSDGSDANGASDGGEDADSGTAAESDEDDQWRALDCSGWDLELQCGLAGECTSGDCNMVCDVTFFGDAYAHTQIELGSVEDAFDYWQRV